jgi:hypothetical protein
MKKNKRTTKSQSSHTDPLLPSPPRPAGENKSEKSAGRTTSATSPATPERGKEGEDHARTTDAIATVFDAVARAHTPRLKGPIYTHERTPELPPTTRRRNGDRRRRGAAEPPARARFALFRLL